MIKYLTIQDEPRPIRVSYYALKKLKEEMGRTLKPDDDGSDYEAYESLLYHSLVKGHSIEKIEMPFKRDEMEELMDEIYFKFMKLVPEFFEDEATEKQPKVVRGGTDGKKPKR